ncbi:cupin domain-containing protein [Marinobacter salarius]|jgi:unsaturated pyranuronate lyase|uniref:cupin domain-containing protein n=1 Tax=Marinobacter salarius TaxID=1420917 RepID=UPI0030093AB1|tara:strand:- start:3452 stop:3832 length:381 start_codon:yes stop_codon:yes gene_type:complete
MTNDIRAKLVTWSSIDSETISKNISRKFVAASKSMIAQLYLKQGAVVPKHHHESEQLSYILEGHLEFTLYYDDREDVHSVKEGDILCIPGNVPHSVVALEDSIDLDIFSPPRWDWIEGTDQYFERD